MALEVIEVPIPGKITSVQVAVDSQVKEGDVVCILESMKMENPILSPVSGIVKEIRVSPAQQVKAGEVIATIEY